MFGDAGIKRADWDIFEHQGVDCVLFALGINDVSQPGSSDEAPPLSERITTEAFVQAVSGLADRLHQKKIRIIGCAITPFGGMGGCCEETMQQRLEINHWLKKAAGEEFWMNISTLHRRWMIRPIPDICWRNATAETICTPVLPEERECRMRSSLKS